ncbi:MAG: MFS transporter [Muribaculaceae bacterium]|nr:MFS transporter [Muribaculaceae bacterium]
MKTTMNKTGKIDGNGTDKRRLHYGFVIVTCCCLVMGIDVGLVFSCAGIFYDPVSRALGVPIGKFGLYMSISYIASTLMLPLAGRLMERYGARKLLTLNSLVLGLTVGAMGLFNSVWEFYGAGVVMGITLSFLLYLSFPILVNAWFRTKVGLMIGICSAASGIGGMLFNPMGGAIISSYGWRAAYLTFGGMILLIVTPVIGSLLRDKPEDKGLLPYGYTEGADISAGAQDKGGVEYGRAVKTPAFYAILLFAFIMMAVSTLNLFIPKYIRLAGFSEVDASLAAAAVMAGVTGGKLLLGAINDRNCLYGVLTCTLFGVAGIVLLLTGGTTMWVLLTGCFLFGWEYAGVTVQTAMLTGHDFGKRDYTRIYALISIALAAGGALASGGWGLLADATSFTTVFITGAVTLAVGCLLGVFAYLRRP